MPRAEELSVIVDCVKERLAFSIDISPGMTSPPSNTLLSIVISISTCMFSDPGPCRFGSRVRLLNIGRYHTLHQYDDMTRQSSSSELRAKS